jgi:multidrug efflux pump
VCKRSTWARARRAGARFITTSRARDRAADGIDYRNHKVRRASTITAHLKLNYDSNKALSEISSKVNQERNNLPPEAEVPVINIEPADSQYASAYLSFTSNILEANEITDYLTRIVQPRLTALPGVQRAEILGGRTFAMRIWLKPDRMAALNVSQRRARRLRPTIFFPRSAAPRVPSSGRPDGEH